MTSTKVKNMTSSHKNYKRGEEKVSFKNKITIETHLQHEPI